MWVGITLRRRGIGRRESRFRLDRERLYRSTEQLGDSGDAADVRCHERKR